MGGVVQISNNNFNQRRAIPRVITIDNEYCTIKGVISLLLPLSKSIRKYKITIYYKGNKIREKCWIDYDEIRISFSRWKKLRLFYKKMEFTEKKIITIP